MRNLNQYPITLEEMASAVGRAYSEECKKASSGDYPIGGIHIAALKAAETLIKTINHKTP